MVIFGVGKPPPPTVPLMQHYGALACSEREAPCHRLVRQGGGKEAKEDDGGGTVGVLREGLSGLRGAIGYIDVFKVSGKGVDDGG